MDHTTGTYGTVSSSGPLGARLRARNPVTVSFAPPSSPGTILACRAPAWRVHNLLAYCCMLTRFVAMALLVVPLALW